MLRFDISCGVKLRRRSGESRGVGEEGDSQKEREEETQGKRDHNSLTGSTETYYLERMEAHIANLFLLL